MGCYAVRGISLDFGSCNGLKNLVRDVQGPVYE